MTPEEILAEAKQLVADGWTQKTYARNAFGRAVNLMQPDACEFCAVGAIRKVTRYLADPSALEAFDKLQAVVGEITDFNDAPRRTKEEVLAAFDKAIARSD